MKRNSRLTWLAPWLAVAFALFWPLAVMAGTAALVVLGLWLSFLAGTAGLALTGRARAGHPRRPGRVKIRTQLRETEPGPFRVLRMTALPHEAPSRAELGHPCAVRWQARARASADAGRALSWKPCGLPGGETASFARRDGSRAAYLVVPVGTLAGSHV